MQLLNMTFTTSQVTEITGLSNDTIQNWIKRGSIIGHRPGGEANITGGGSQGRHRQFGYFAVMQFAMTAAFVQLGIGATEAAKMAADFAHVGGGGEVFGLPERLPGMPFHYSHGRTVFAANAARSFETITNGPRDVLVELRHHLGSVFAVVDALDVFIGVCGGIARVTGRAQDFHPFNLLDEAYPEEAKG